MALQHLRSSTADKRPTPAAMSDGQLALNTNLVSPGLFFKDSNGDSVKIGPVHVGTTAPNVTPGAGGQAGNSKGEAWLDTTATNPILKVWNGSAFVAVQPVGTGTVVSTTDSGTVTSTMILDGTILNADINASAAIVDTKLATISTAGKVSNSATTATNANTASAIVARDASGNFSAGTITAAVTGAASSNVLKAGDTMTGALVVPLASAATPSLTFTGDLNTGIYSPAADTIAFAEGGSEVARLDSSGRLLVGTSSAYTVEGFNRHSYFCPTAGETNNQIVVSAVGAAGFPAIYFTKTRGASPATQTIVQDNDSLGRIRFFGSDGVDYDNSAAAIDCLVDGTPGANDMPGRLVFSTTADGASSPTERMRISSTGRTAIAHGNLTDLLAVDSTNASFASAVFLAATARGAGTSCFYLYGQANSVNTFIVYNNGNIVNTNNSYGAISDIKLKENIVDATSQWSDIKNLQVRKYNFKEETGQQTHTQIGLVAQEVELVSPGLVIKTNDRDEDGNDLGTVTKNVNYSVLYMKAVKALQEAMERIESLEQRLNDAGIN